MKTTYVIEGRIYQLTKNQVKELHSLFPEFWTNLQSENFSNALAWIEEKGKYQGTATVYHY